jgi:hypothetical protein
MEDVLEVYHRPFDPQRPVICLDEASKQLIGETRLPLPPEPGQPERFEVHHTPKHGSWLNIAAIELSALSGQCLARRIEDRATLEREVAAWQIDRDERCVAVDWQFTAKDARIRLRRLYPSFQT